MKKYINRRPQILLTTPVPALTKPHGQKNRRTDIMIMQNGFYGKKTFEMKFVLFF